MAVTILLFVVYVLSVVGYYRYVSICYSENGWSSNGSPNIVDFMIMIVPFLNTIMCVVMWTSGSPYKKTYREHKQKGINLWDIVFNTKKKIIITEEEKILIDTYKRGYDDEAHEKPELFNPNPLLLKIYKFGRKEAWKQVSDDQSDEEIVKKIRNFLKE